MQFLQVVDELEFEIVDFRCIPVVHYLALEAAVVEEELPLVVEAELPRLVHETLLDSLTGPYCIESNSPSALYYIV